MPGIIDLPKFNYEDLEEIVAGGQGSFIQFAGTLFYLKRRFYRDRNMVELHTPTHRLLLAFNWEKGGKSPL